MKQKIINKYCIGCGLCQSVQDFSGRVDEDGFWRPEIEKKDNLDFFESVCPMSRTSFEKLDTNSIWGKYEKLYLGYASEKEIRTHASSGGVLTALCIYLLEKNIIDGVLHTKVSDSSCIETTNCCSDSKEKLMDACGSRYSISHPLNNIIQSIDLKKRYVFIGKPCDVTALNNFLEINSELKKNIIYTFSFFCAGLPSKMANQKLLKSLDVDEENCASLTYRGDGWPGKVTAIDKKGNVHKMEYEDAWGGSLGRDINPFCRVCMDGIGERADVSCGDGWYLDENNEPDFEEKDGRNIIFARTNKGQQVIYDASEAGYLDLFEFNDLKQLKAMQKYQFERKATMLEKIIALRMMFRTSPEYSIFRLRNFHIGISIKRRIRLFVGSIKRIIKGRM